MILFLFPSDFCFLHFTQTKKYLCAALFVCFYYFSFLEKPFPHVVLDVSDFCMTIQPLLDAKLYRLSTPTIFSRFSTLSFVLQIVSWGTAYLLKIFCFQVCRKCWVGVGGHTHILTNTTLGMHIIITCTGIRLLTTRTVKV